jgi:hypothetical protein
MARENHGKKKVFTYRIIQEYQQHNHIFLPTEQSGNGMNWV